MTVEPLSSRARKSHEFRAARDQAELDNLKGMEAWVDTLKEELERLNGVRQAMHDAILNHDRDGILKVLSSRDFVVDADFVVYA